MRLKTYLEVSSVAIDNIPWSSVRGQQVHVLGTKNNFSVHEPKLGYLPCFVGSKRIMSVFGSKVPIFHSRLPRPQSNSSRASHISVSGHPILAGCDMIPLA